MSNLPNFPTIRPSLLLDFASSKQVDPRITFTRASTATYFDAQGVLRIAASGVPRIDHDPVTGECKGLLIEEARTNLLSYSEQFDNAAWTKNRSTITANAATAPDGTLTADKLVEDTTASSTHYFRSASYAATGITLTVSIYAKAAERSRVRIDISNFLDGAATATFNLSAGSTIDVGSNTSDYTDVSATCTSVGNGWYRCTLTATKGSANSTNIVICNLDNGTTSTYTGDGTSGLYIWGAQLEAGSSPTSYIPTTSAAATRAADVASMSGTNFSEWYRQDEGTFVCTATSGAVGTSARVLFGVSGGSFDNTIYVFRAPGASTIAPVIQAGGVAQLSDPILCTATAGTPFTVAASFKTNDFAGSGNGGAVVTDTSVTLPSVSSFSIGTAPWSPGGNLLNGHISRIAYYPVKFSSSQLQAITA